jgi:hypothetical protein
LRIRIRNSDASKNAHLASFHAPRIGRPLVIETLKMKHTVNDEVREVGAHRFALRFRLPEKHRHADDNVPQLGTGAAGGEREHVGGAVLAPKALIEPATFCQTD